MTTQTENDQQKSPREKTDDLINSILESDFDNATKQLRLLSEILRSLAEVRQDLGTGNADRYLMADNIDKRLNRVEWHLTAGVHATSDLKTTLDRELFSIMASVAGIHRHFVPDDR